MGVDKIVGGLGGRNRKLRNRCNELISSTGDCGDVAGVLAAVSQNLAQRKNALTQVGLVYHSARPDEGEQFVLIQEASALLN